MRVTILQERGVTGDEKKTVTSRVHVGEIKTLTTERTRGPM